jgi:hypothetical protein
MWLHIIQAFLYAVVLTNHSLQYFCILHHRFCEVSANLSSVVTSQWRQPVGVHWTANRSVNHSDSFSEISKDADIDIIEHSYPDAAIGLILVTVVVILMMVRQVQM